MADGLAHPDIPGRASPGLRTALADEQDEALAPFVGREFAAALREGLRRAQTTQRTSTSPAPERPPDSRMTRGVALLADHSQAILAHFDESLVCVPDLAGPAHTPQRAALATWARQVLDAINRLDGPGRQAQSRAARLARQSGPPARRLVLAVPLLIESAAVALPSGDAATAEAIHTLARAVRLAGTGATEASSPPRRSRVSGPAAEHVRAAMPGARRSRA